MPLPVFTIPASSPTTSRITGVAAIAAPVLLLASTVAYITDGGGNLDDGTSCAFSDPTSQSGADAGLDPAGLEDNGGPTETIALLAGSDAIDRAVDALCAAEPVGNVDQRGFERPVDGDEDGTPSCDVGAFEQGAGTAPPSALPHFLCYKTRASRGDVCAPYGRIRL